jgi:hypothetical protein
VETKAHGGLTRRMGQSTTIVATLTKHMGQSAIMVETLTKHIWQSATIGCNVANARRRSGAGRPSRAAPCACQPTRSAKRWTAAADRKASSSRHSCVAVPPLANCPKEPTESNCIYKTKSMRYKTDCCTRAEGIQH